MKTSRSAFTRLRLAAWIALVLLLPLATRVAGSPGAATWYRESLLGENGSHYFLLASTMVNEGTYYRDRELQRILRIDKRSGAVVDSILVRSSEHLVDAATMARSAREEDLPPFDLAGYLRGHGTHAPYSQDPEFQAELDSTGLYLQLEDRREVLVATATIRRPFLPSPEPDEIALLGAEFTLAHPDSGVSRMTYYRIRSFPAGSDVSSSEILIMVPDDQVDAILRLDELSRDRRQPRIQSRGS